MQTFIELMRGFCAGALTPREFEQQYLDLWRDARDKGLPALSKPEAEILDALFYEVDAFTDDPRLLRHPDYGAHSISEPQLRSAVKHALERLMQLEAKGKQ